MLRAQILKEEDELNKAFGSGPAKPVLPKRASGEEEGQKMTKIMIFGNSNQCEIAQRMIEEAIDNKVNSLYTCEHQHVLSLWCAPLTSPVRHGPTLSSSPLPCFKPLVSLCLKVQLMLGVFCPKLVSTLS